MLFLNPKSFAPWPTKSDETQMVNNSSIKAKSTPRQKYVVDEHQAQKKNIVQSAYQNLNLLL